MKTLTRLFSFFICLISYNLSIAQQPTDCINSVIVCGNSNVSLDVNGIGFQELDGLNNCGSRENNSVWLKVTVASNGTLAFTLKPESNDIKEDYDFFIFGPDVTCNNLGQAIRCSTTNPEAAMQGNNRTGMNGSEVDTSEGPGPDGNSFVRWIDVLDGETYYIVIDRPHGSSAFSLDWTGSAEFLEAPTNEAVSQTALNLESCDIEGLFNDGFTSFDLTINDTQVIGSQTNVRITYHQTESDANIGINNIVGSYINIENPQTVFARITDNASGCFEIAEFDLIVNIGPNINESGDINVCDNINDGDDTNGQITFDLNEVSNEISTGQDPSNLIISYYESYNDAENELNQLPTIYYNTTPFNQEIFVRVEDANNTNCMNIFSFLLIVNPSIKPESVNTTLIQCDEDGIMDGRTFFNLEQVNTILTEGIADRSTYFYTNIFDAEANNISNAINSQNFNNTINPQTIFVSIVNDTTGCFGVSELTLEVSTTSTSDAQLTACDDDGLEDGVYTFNLNEADNDIVLGLAAGLVISYYKTYEDALLETNILDTTFTNTIPNNQTIFARVENVNDCYGISEVALSVYELPDINTELLTYYCLNNFPQTIPLDAGVIDNMPENYNYTWSNGETTFEIQVNQPNNYTVLVTNTNGCSKERNIIVEASNIATFDSIKVVDATQNNTVTILVSGEGIYEYALLNNNDGFQTPFQSNHIFENVFPGIYTVLVKDVKNDCGTVENQVSVIGFPKFFTPNNDGRNDTWQVYGVSSQFQPNSKIRIFNRYGKLIKQISPTSKGWNGTFNGTMLPNDDYWFSVMLQDGRIFKSHFTLKR